MIIILKIVPYLCMLRWIEANGIYFHEPSYIEIRPANETNPTDFGFTMGYSNKRNKLVVGAPHHDLIGKVFECDLKDVTTNKTGECIEIDINMDKLAGDYKRDKTPNQSFCLGGSIAVGENYTLICAPLWTSERIESKIDYGAYGTCFIVTDTNITRYNGFFQQESIIRLNKPKLYGGSGWSTLIDDKNNVSLISLAPFSPHISDIGYMHTSPADKVRLLKILSRHSHKFKKIGTFVSGLFFGDKISYASSSRYENLDGLVIFLQENNLNHELTEVRTNKRKFLSLRSTNENAGSMFGAAMYATDVNADGFSDLLVGAPAHGNEYNCEAGALHIYLGGSKEKLLQNHTIIFDKVGAHFGQAIAADDVDKDGFPEIFVSAPFEDSGIGAIYVLNGQEIKKFVENVVTVTPLSKFNLTQRIQNKKFKSFGYSLQPLPDLDGNGRTEISVGAPDSGKVLLYRSIPAIQIDISSKKNTDYVKLKDKSVVIILTVTIKYPENIGNVSEELIINTNVKENDISLSNANITLNIKDKQPIYLLNTTVEFSNEEPGFFKFHAEVMTRSESYLSSEVFDETRLVISPYSNTKTTLELQRLCIVNCEPKLSASIQWNGRSPYTLGSSINETLTVMVLNKGNDSFTSCVKILIKGGKVVKMHAKQELPNLYKYSPPQPFKRNETRAIDFTIGLSELTNLDKKLEVKVFLHNVCDNNATNTTERDIPFVLSTNQIYVNGISNERNVTDTQILTNKSLTDNHVYNIINNASVTWKSVQATINVNKKSFITAYRIFSPEGVTCQSKEYKDIYSYVCNFDLERRQTLQILIKFDIAMNEFMNSLEKGHLKTSSNFELLLNTDKKINGITTTFNYIQDIGLGQNMYLIIAIAVLVSVGFISLLNFILYKMGFFKSPEKTKLAEMKHEIFKQSIRRANPEEVRVISESQQANAETGTTNGVRMSAIRESNGEEELSELQKFKEEQESEIRNDNEHC